jgi:hypothetical protein
MMGCFGQYRANLQWWSPFGYTHSRVSWRLGVGVGAGPLARFVRSWHRPQPFNVIRLVAMQGRREQQENVEREDNDTEQVGQYCRVSY